MGSTKDCKRFNNHRIPGQVCGTKQRGNNSITGSEKIRSAQKSSNFLITDLAMGTLYGISVAGTTFYIPYSNLISCILILAPSRKFLTISSVTCTIFRLKLTLVQIVLITRNSLKNICRLFQLFLVDFYLALYYFKLNK